MSKYIVWLDNRTEGWSRSDELETLEDCFNWLRINNYGSPYLITKLVTIQFEEIDSPANQSKKEL